MKKLSAAGFEQAKAYLFSHGRELDQTIFSYFFEGGSKKAIMAALGKYQNSDGGFGHALEPDLRTPLSSAIATSQAMLVLRLIKAGTAEPLVEKAVRYLIKTYDPKNSVWPIIPEGADEAPHAFWWASDGIEDRFGRFLINPTVAIIGHLQSFSRLVPEEFLRNLLTIAMTRLSSLSGAVGMYDLLCYMDLLVSDGLPQAIQNEVATKLATILPLTIERAPENWANHGLAPLGAIKERDHPLAATIEPALLQQNLDHDIGSQLVDGSWQVPWSWEALFPDAWRQAERDWKGHFIVQKLLTLRSFQRL